MGWFSFNASTDYKHGNTQTAAYGDNKPIISDQYDNAYKRYSSGLYTGSDGSTNGANGPQQEGIDWTRNNLNNGPVRPATNTANAAHAASGRDLNSLNTDYLEEYLARGANTLDKWYPGEVKGEVTDSEFAPDVNARTGADYMSLYANPWERDVVDTSLADYDYGVGEGFAALHGANAGSFANKRTGVAESNYLDAATRGRGSLAAGIRSEGFKGAAGYGASDADRRRLADTTTAGNFLSTSQFNAGQRTKMSMDNANLLDSRQQFNLTQADKSLDRNIGIVKDMANNIKSKVDIDQKILDNIVKANGIDTEAAHDLFTAGTITQSQLEKILEAATEYNGSSFTRNGSTTSNDIDVKAEVGFK